MRLQKRLMFTKQQFIGWSYNMFNLKENSNSQDKMLKNNLVIFDVDGTLTDTMDIDTTCFAESIHELYPGITINTNWESYQYSTDTGFLLEIFSNNFSREPTGEELRIASEITSHFWSINDHVFIGLAV